MAVYDVFPFYNELDILEIRLNTLDPIVDFFVITEATTTFAGHSKKLYLTENLEKFSKFKEKIILQVVNDVPQIAPFERDWFQRDQAKSFLDKNLSESDYLIYGDVDEIPKLDSVGFATDLLNDSRKIAHFAQDLNYYYLNLKETSGKLLSYMGEYAGIEEKKWLGSTLSKWSYSRNFSMTALRNPGHKGNGVRIDNAGWHFSYVGGEPGVTTSDRARNKVINAAHQELNTRKIHKKIEKATHKHTDIFNRKGANFEVIHETSYLPEYVQLNLDKFRNLITR
jgi:beta-1,4-mannosyl-glycoprotein beta-1,4-N-acetylglucosaminyltransferase